MGDTKEYGRIGGVGGDYLQLSNCFYFEYEMNKFINEDMFEDVFGIEVKLWKRSMK